MKESQGSHHRSHLTVMTLYLGKQKNRIPQNRRAANADEEDPHGGSSRREGPPWPRARARARRNAGSNAITWQTYFIGMLSTTFCQRRNILPGRVLKAHLPARRARAVYYFNFSLSPDVRQGQDILSSASSLSRPVLRRRWRRR